jgi:hypothetical protein
MGWRVGGSNDAEDRRCCPTCRLKSDYVVPSLVFPTSASEKQEIVAQYKLKLSAIPCKRFDGNLGSCPFGSDCFFAHRDGSGEDVKAQDQTMQELKDLRRRRQQQRRRARIRRRQFEEEENEEDDDLLLEDMLYTMMMIRMRAGRAADEEERQHDVQVLEFLEWLVARGLAVGDDDDDDDEEAY